MGWWQLLELPPDGDFSFQILALLFKGCVILGLLLASLALVFSSNEMKTMLLYIMFLQELNDIIHIKYLEHTQNDVIISVERTQHLKVVNFCSIFTLIQFCLFCMRKDAKSK